jgi:uncharacterized membrane protein YgaE (UPF0421/DUF939 family)
MYFPPKKELYIPEAVQYYFFIVIMGIIIGLLVNLLFFYPKKIKPRKKPRKDRLLPGKKR